MIIKFFMTEVKDDRSMIYLSDISRLKVVVRHSTPVNGLKRVIQIGPVIQILANQTRENVNELTVHPMKAV
jgi:spore germination protein GerM